MPIFKLSQLANPYRHLTQNSLRQISTALHTDFRRNGTRPLYLRELGAIPGDRFNREHKGIYAYLEHRNDTRDPLWKMVSGALSVYPLDYDTIHKVHQTITGNPTPHPPSVMTSTSEATPFWHNWDERLAGMASLSLPRYPQPIDPVYIVSPNVINRRETPVSVAPTDPNNMKATVLGNRINRQQLDAILAHELAHHAADRVRLQFPEHVQAIEETYADNFLFDYLQWEGYTAPEAGKIISRILHSYDLGPMLRPQRMAAWRRQLYSRWGLSEVEQRMVGNPLMVMDSPLRPDENRSRNYRNRETTLYTEFNNFFNPRNDPGPAAGNLLADDNLLVNPQVVPPMLQISGKNSVPTVFRFRVPQDAQGRPVSPSRWREMATRGEPVSTKGYAGVYEDVLGYLHTLPGEGVTSDFIAPWDTALRAALQQNINVPELGKIRDRTSGYPAPE